MLNYERVYVCVHSMYMCIYSHVHFCLNFTFTAVGKNFGRGLGISMVVCLDTEANRRQVIFVLMGLQFSAFWLLFGRPNAICKHHQSITHFGPNRILKTTFN